MALAAWIAAIVTALCFVLLLKGTVRLVSKGADNGWDNAIAYTVVTTLLFVGLKWLIGTRIWLLIGLSPLIMWVGQTVALRVIYQIKTGHALLIGVTHAVATSAVLTTLTMVAGVVAAYLLYGKIISDPMFLVRLILKLIGIWDAPLEVP